jgi:beta-glucosidase
MVNDAAAIPQLHIPKFNWWNEALHGVARVGAATVFPQAIGLAASWDINLMSKVSDAISTEARAKYNQAIKIDEHEIYKGLTLWSRISIYSAIRDGDEDKKPMKKIHI